MSQPAASFASRLVTRGALLTVIVLASLGALAALVYGALAQTALTTGAATISTDVLGAEPLTPNADLPPEVDAQFESVRFFFPAGSNPAEFLQAIAVAVPYVVCGLTCLVIILLATHLLQGRPFGIGTATAMFSVAVISIAAGFARPALLAQAERVFIESLGLPTAGGTAEVWFSPSQPSWEFSDWPLILLGLLIALGGWIILRARQLRLDLDGTI